jgi:hypothetical protein
MLNCLAGPMWERFRLGVWPIIVVTGDPLRDISLLEEVDFVMKGGVVYKR